jgi:hypothetical protein
MRHRLPGGRRHQGLELCPAAAWAGKLPCDDRQRSTAGRCVARREPARGTSAGYGLDEINAYMLLSQAGRIRLGNMVDPKFTMGASIIRKYLAS